MISKQSRMAREVVAPTLDVGALGIGGVTGNTCIVEIVTTQSKYEIKKALQTFGVR